jgi:hypothetical protein
MKITDDTRFPHPVLSDHTGDYSAGAFTVSIVAHEILGTGALTLDYEVSLTEPNILNLITSGQATLGCFVRCEDTFFTELRQLSWPKGRVDFAAGSLLNRVTLLPVIWLSVESLSWNPGTIHLEFAPPIELKLGDILAIGAEFVMSIGQAKFASVESIFELRKTSDLSGGQMQIDLEGDRIGILVPPAIYDAITSLRGRADGQPVVMNSVYLPATIEVLNQLGADVAAFDGHRWYQPCWARCEMKGIVPGQGAAPTLESAQSVLEDPLRTLTILVADGEG